jgi:hypothetical protein
MAYLVLSWLYENAIAWPLRAMGFTRAHRIAYFTLLYPVATLLSVAAWLLFPQVIRRSRFAVFETPGKAPRIIEEVGHEFDLTGPNPEDDDR